MKRNLPVLDELVMKKLSWIEKLDRSLEPVVSDEVRKKIMAGSESLTSGSSPGTKAKWVKAAMDRLDTLLDEKTRVNFKINNRQPEFFS